MGNLERTAGYTGQGSYYMRNPPWALPLVLPLGYVGARVAVLPWSLLMLGLLLLSVQLLRPMLGLSGWQLRLLGLRVSSRAAMRRGGANIAVRPAGPGAVSPPVQDAAFLGWRGALALHAEAASLSSLRARFVAVDRGRAQLQNRPWRSGRRRGQLPRGSLDRPRRVFSILAMGALLRHFGATGSLFRRAAAPAHRSGCAGPGVCAGDPRLRRGR